MTAPAESCADPVALRRYLTGMDVEQWIGRAILLVLLLLAGSAVHWLRGWGAERRRWLMPQQAGVRVPVRLRGGSLRYPGFWRVGRLDLATALWQPRGRWGTPTAAAFTV